MMTFASLVSWINAAIAFGTVIMFGSIGEILTEKVGNLNLGVPGVMYLGGIASLAGVFFYERSTDNPIPIVCVIIAILCAFLAAALGGLIYSFLTITLRANQNVTGLTLTIFGSGVANFFGGSLIKLSGGVGQISVSTTSKAFRTQLPFLSDSLGPVSSIFFSYGFLVYGAIIIAIVAHCILNKTKTGLKIRAIGENPATADAAGVNVTKYKYLTICIGTGICGLGGLYYVMDYIKGTWGNDGSIEALGWLAVALVIFTNWRPVNAIWGAYLFGLCYWLYVYLPSGISEVIANFMGLEKTTHLQNLFKMLPYIVTIVVLVLVSFRRKRESQPPLGLGLPYFREDR